MTEEQLKAKLNEEYGREKPWPKHMNVDSETYANVCQAVFDKHGADNDGSAVRRLTLSFGVNNGILYKNVELILSNPFETASVEKTYLNISDLKVFYDLIEKQYINYENIEAIKLIRKVRALIGELI